MCLAVPMEIVAIDRLLARCRAAGAERDVGLFLLLPDEVAVGDHVLVHGGQAIQKISAEEARQTWALFATVLAAADAVTAAGAALQ